IADYATYGLTAPPETFPKQPRIRPGKYGNWLRLPGRHHTRDHWSRVWDGERWLDGADAVSYILAHRPSPSSCIPDFPLPVRPSIPVRAGVSRFGDVAADRLTRRILGYLSRLPRGLGEGQHRDDFGYSFACWLVRDLHLPDAVALDWMHRWDELNAVAKGEERLRELLKNAPSYGQRPYGCGLSPEPLRRVPSIPRWRLRKQNVDSGTIAFTVRVD